MLKRTLSQILFISIGLTCSLISHLSGETFKSLTVTGTAKVNHLHVVNKTHMDGHLDVNNNVSIENHLYVGGDQQIKGHLNVSGNEHIDGKLTVDGNGVFQEKIIVEDDGIFKQKLIVEDDAIFKDDVIVKGDEHVNGTLQVDGNGSFKSDLIVEGLLHAKANLEVDGDVCIKGNECVGKNLNVGGDETVAGNLTVKNLNVTQNLNVGKNETIGGNLLVGGNESISGSLNVGESVNISEDLNVGGNENISGNLNVGGNECIGGDLCINKTLSTENIDAQNLTVDQLTVNKDAQVLGTLFVNEIDPLGNCGTTHFSGNVAIDRCKKLYVNEIDPTPKNSSQCCQDPNSGTICFSGNAAVDPQRMLLVNYINPVQKTECGDCLPDENGVTCFSGNVAVEPNHTLLVNWIDPVQFDQDCMTCIANDNGVTCFSGNAAINPDRALWVNEINPVRMDELGNCIADDTGITCFSGNVALQANKVLYVNEINPVADCCSPLVGPCALTNFSGNIRIKNSHIFGQLTTKNKDGDPITLDCAEREGFDYDYDETIFSALVDFPVTKAQPVLRLNFKDTEAASLGAWVKIDFFGTAHVNGCEGECATTTDIFTELYFFVGAGCEAPCSSLVGSLSTPRACQGFNTLTSFGCTPSKNVFAARNPWTRPSLRAPMNNRFKWGSPLFEFMPTAEGLASVSIIGATACSRCPNSPNKDSVDILLLGMMPGIEFDPKAELFFYPNPDNSEPVYLDGECPFYIDNITIFYEVISPNLDPENPPCFADPLFDCSVYSKAALDAVTTFTLALEASSDYCEYNYYYNFNP